MLTRLVLAGMVTLSSNSAGALLVDPPTGSEFAQLGSGRPFAVDAPDAVLAAAVVEKASAAASVDWLQYVASYGDLIRAFGADRLAGERHYDGYGRAEGRALDRFNERQYLANYADLRAAYGNDLQAAIQHFIIYGYYEGRTDADNPVALDIAASIGIGYPMRYTSNESSIVDLNDDGVLDIVLSGHMRSNWPIMINKGGIFSSVQALPDRGDRHMCTAADFNQDGRPDLYCAHGACEGRCSKEFHNELFLQLPNGLYSTVNQLTQSADARTLAKHWGVADGHSRGREPLAIDFDKDGRTDIVLTNQTPSIYPTPNRLFKNVGGKFVEVTDTPIRRESGSECVETADIDNDGWSDLVFCSSGGSKILTYMNSMGVFQETTSSRAYKNAPARNISLTDVNGDTQPDLLIVGQKQFSIWLNVRGEFPAPTFSFPLSDGRHVAVGDVNGDENPDIYLVQGRNSLYPDIMLIADIAGRKYHTMAVPQTNVGEGDAAVPYPNWNGSGRTAFLVTNGRLQNPGPVQFIAFFPSAL